MADDRAAKLQSLKIDRQARVERRGVPGAVAVVIAIVSATAGATGMYAFGPKPEAPPAQTPAVSQPAAPAATAPSETNTAQTNTASARTPRATGLVASGYVVPRRQATVSAEITGRIREVLVEEGTVVEAGEIIARLDDERARLDLALLEARLQSSRSRIASLLAQRTESEVVLERAQALAQRNVGSQAAVTAAIAQRDSLNAQIASARADFAAAEVQVASQRDLIDRHVVRAPFAGVVIAKNAQVGEILSPASAGGGFTRTGVATLVDMASLEIQVDVNEGQIGRVTPGQRVEAVLDSYPDWRIPARVEAIIPTADRSRATIQVRVAFEERDGRILPDMAARVTFVE